MRTKTKLLLIAAALVVMMPVAWILGPGHETGRRTEMLKRCQDHPCPRFTATDRQISGEDDQTEDKPLLSDAPFDAPTAAGTIVVLEATGRGDWRIIKTKPADPMREKVWPDTDEVPYE